MLCESTASAAVLPVRTGKHLRKLMQRQYLWPHGPLYRIGRPFRRPVWEVQEPEPPGPEPGDLPAAVPSATTGDTATPAALPSAPPTPVVAKPERSEAEPERTEPECSEAEPERSEAVPASCGEAAPSPPVAEAGPPASQRPQSPAQSPVGGPPPTPGAADGDAAPGLAEENAALRREVRTLRRQLAGFLQHAAQCYSAVDWACLEASCSDDTAANCRPRCDGSSSSAPAHLPNPGRLSDATLMPPPPPRPARPPPAPTCPAEPGSAPPTAAADLNLDPTLQCDSDSETERLSQDVPVSQLRPQPYYYGTRFPRSSRIPHPTFLAAAAAEAEPEPEPGKRVRITERPAETWEFGLESPPQTVRKKARTLRL
eukprot:EG_transcript_14124